jgi:hypothetical protein
MYMRRKKEKAAYVNYEKKAGMERDEDGKRKGEFRWGGIREKKKKKKGKMRRSR